MNLKVVDNCSTHDHTLKAIHLYTDASYDQNSKKGVAGVMVVKWREEPFTFDSNLASEAIINIKFFENTNCTSLEFEAIIWAMEALKELALETKIRIYTDCKSAVDLPRRRKHLENTQFISKRTGALLNNTSLYIKFFKLLDCLNPELVWVKGHKPAVERSLTDHLFNMVDKATRKALREVKLGK
ncbi:MAG: RNase H family protein [Bdellovibrionota bacterium]